MSPGSGNRQTGTIPKTKVRNNCNVPQEAVTPTRRDLNLGNLVTTSLDLVPVPEFSVNSTQNRNRRSGADEDSSNPEFVHEGGRFVPVRPQPRTPVAKSSVNHRECPGFSRYRDSLPSSEQMDESFGSPNSYFSNQSQRQNNAAAVMVVNPTTANSGSQQIQQNTENAERMSHPPPPNSVEFELGQIRSYIRATSNLVQDLRAVENEDEGQEKLLQELLNKLNKMKDNEKKLEVMLLRSPQNTTNKFENNMASESQAGSSSKGESLEELPQENVEKETFYDENCSSPGLTQSRKTSTVSGSTSHLEVNETSKQSNRDRLRSQNSKEDYVDKRPLDNKDLKLCDFGVTDKLDASVSNITNEQQFEASDRNSFLQNVNQEARPTSSQSNCSGYSENELYQNELRVKVEKSQQRIQALQDQQKQLLMCQQEAKNQILKMNAAFANRPSHENEQPCQLNCTTLTNGLLSETGTNTQNQQVNAMQSERFLRNPPQMSQGTSLHQENFTEGCQPFQDTLEQLGSKLGALGDMIISQASDSEDEEDSRRHHNVELQRKLMELQTKTSHIENMVNFANYKKDRTVCIGPEPSVSNDGQRKSRRSNCSSLSPVLATGDVPHDYAYSQDNAAHSQSSDEDSQRDINELANNGADFSNSQVAQINVMEMKLEKLKGMMQTVASIENRLATSVLNDSSYSPNTQQSNNVDNMRARPAMEDSFNCNNGESNEHNLRNRYDDINQPKHQNYNVNLESRRYEMSTANKCRNNEDQNTMLHDKMSTSMSAMNELTEQLKREVRDIAEQRQRLRKAGQHSGHSRHSEHPGHSTHPGHSAHPGQFSDKGRNERSHTRESEHCKDGSPSSTRRSGAQSQQSSLSGTSLSSQRSGTGTGTLPGRRSEREREQPIAGHPERTAASHSCACQPHHGFSSEQDEEDASTLSLVHRKNNKNTSSSTSCATREEQQDHSVHCTHTPMSTPDQYKEESTYCDSAHSLDTSAVIPNESSSSNHTAYRVNHPHSKQRQRGGAVGGGAGVTTGSAGGGGSSGSVASLPPAPPPLSPPSPPRGRRHRWPPYFLHSDAHPHVHAHAHSQPPNTLPHKESSCSGGETSTSIGQNINDNHRSSWWQQKAEQLQQQLEQTRNLCQSLLQDRRFSRLHHNETSQTLEAPGSVGPHNFPGTFMLPYGVMVPMAGELGMSGGGAVGGAGGVAVGAGVGAGAGAGAWWALAGCYNHLNSQQWEISTLRNSLMMLEEKYLSLANLVNLRAHSTPPNMNVPDEFHQSNATRARSALSGNNLFHWQNNQGVPFHQPYRYHASVPNDSEQPATVAMTHRNTGQDHVQNVNCHFPVNQTNSWTSHEVRSQSNEPTSRSAQIKVAIHPTQQNILDGIHSGQNNPQHEVQQPSVNFNASSATVFNNCAPPAAPNLNILNSLEPQLIQNNTNPNCLLSLTPAQQSLINQTATGSPIGHNSTLIESAAGQNMALNNQVPPGNRANNYWDNFRSYSRQNLLSGSSKINADSLMGNFTMHNPQPLVERSHNTLHSSSTNNMANNTPTNTPKRNINSASANASNLSHNAGSHIGAETVRNRGRRNISQEMSIFTAPPDVLNVNQSSEIATETELNSIILNDDSANRLNSSVNVNMNREYDSRQDRNINVVNPIPEILVSHTNNFLNMGGIKRKSSSKLPAKNTTATNYSSDHIQNRNIGLTSTTELPNLNLASTSSSNSQDKSTSKIFDLLRENVYSEVTALISANENHPDFLIQLFRDLQQIRSDPLRQRMLDSIQEVSHNVSNVEEHLQHVAGPSRSSVIHGSEQAVTSSSEKFSVQERANETNVAQFSTLNGEVVHFVSEYEGFYGAEFLSSLIHLIQSLFPTERLPSDFISKLNSCLSKYENKKLPEIADAVLSDISTFLNISNSIKRDRDINIETNNEMAKHDENGLQDIAGSLEHTLPSNSNDNTENNIQSSDYGEGDVCLPPNSLALPSCSQQIDHDALRNGSGEGVIHAHRLIEPKIDLIESAEVCNGDLAEADQSRHSDASMDQSIAAGSDSVLQNVDALPDLVETEEQTPTEAEAEWLDRIPTRLHSEDGPENQSESGQG